MWLLWPFPPVVNEANNPDIFFNTAPKVPQFVSDVFLVTKRTGPGDKLLMYGPGAHAGPS
jgi:hypothetical protein